MFNYSMRCMLKKKKGIILLILIIAILTSACAQKAEEPEESNSDRESALAGYYYINLGVPIEDFELKDLDGNTVKLSDQKGKIVFLNFWATWCPPCRDEMPYMQEFHEKYKDEDVVILAVNPNQVENRGMDNAEKAEESVRKFISEYGYTFPILLDADDSVWAVYQQRGVPTNYIIDKEGIVRYLKLGAFSGLKEMEDFAETLGLSVK
ncbi:MAG: TlpA disulfide reductase family protein [Caldicoprobacterales bacterium]|jgi:thiol-disulfide isomerase/thioredoxin|nr:TlpA family protein disulfide reductase [Clostridiales bacterium]